VRARLPQSGIADLLDDLPAKRLPDEVDPGEGLDRGAVVGADPFLLA
jgi:hypothetical protein